jgi:hypothetical protein
VKFFFEPKYSKQGGNTLVTEGLVTCFDGLSGLSLFQVRLEFHPSGTTLGFLAPTFNYRGSVKGGVETSDLVGLIAATPTQAELGWGTRFRVFRV